LSSTLNDGIAWISVADVALSQDNSSSGLCQGNGDRGADACKASAWMSSTAYPSMLL
jgi:hypothetical protein